MRVCGDNANYIEATGKVMGFIAAVGLVASAVLGCYLKYGSLGKALHFRVSIATLSTILGTVAALFLTAVLWKAKKV